ncbi:unnamed protein product [Mytilus coruscus]|uniref:LRAT domain-containing protein n=1 Tax=Mytilus coruscus TaxID=42192 RepID=A0A6J8ED51_MYTCO|nr:unnamed protein product [Mytilus coruscus]
MQVGKPVEEIVDDQRGKRRKDDSSEIEFKKEKKIYATTDFKIGLEVAFGRLCLSKDQFIYKHHGIITNICDCTNQFEIVELTANDTPGVFSAAISSRNMRPKIMKQFIPFDEPDLFCYDYKHLSFSNEIIKERTELVFRTFSQSGLQYNLKTFNCEHLASYCTTGVAFSKQIPIVEINKDATETLDKM